jgi:predicted dehydrogenase
MANHRILLIGAGVIARFHAKAAGKLPHPVELWAADPSAAAREQFLEQFPGSRLFEDHRAMLREPARNGDIVVVATPPLAHHEPTITGLNSGRHVLCEKPLALNTQQAREMLAAAKKNDRLLGCCSTRFLGIATNEHVKRLLSRGELGELYHVTWVHRQQRMRPGIEYQPASVWFTDKRISGGGCVMDWGPYDFAALNDVLQPRRVEVLQAWMNRPVTEIDSQVPVMDVEHHAAVMMRYTLAGGRRVDVSYERAACTHGGVRQIAEIEGTRAAVQWDWQAWKERPEVTVTTDRGGKPHGELFEFDRDPSLHPHDRPVVYFDRAVRGEGGPALVNERALFNFSCIRAVYDAAANGRPQVVELEVS